MEKKPRKSPEAFSGSTTDPDPIFVVLLLVALYLATLIFVPFGLAKFVNPWLGVTSAIVAIPAWIKFGPPAMPGFLNGFLCLQGLLLLLMFLLVHIGRAF